MNSGLEMFVCLLDYGYRYGLWIIRNVVCV